MIHNEHARPCECCGNDDSDYRHDLEQHLCDECAKAYEMDFDAIWRASYWIYSSDMQQRLDYFEMRVIQEAEQ